MSADGRRQLLGILRHYGHGLRAQFRGAGTFIGFAFSMFFALALGSLATRNAGRPELLGYGSFLDGASLFDMQMGSALRMTALTLQVAYHRRCHAREGAICSTVSSEIGPRAPLRNSLSRVVAARSKSSPPAFLARQRTWAMAASSPWPSQLAGSGP